MQHRVRVKICGLTKPEDMAALAAHGAAYGGLVFFEKSSRHLGLAQARAVALAAPDGLARVGLFVDPETTLLEAVLEEVPLDLIQLHGKESPARVAEVRQRFGLPVIKAVGLATEADIPAIASYTEAADMLLIDAKAPAGAALPGGNGIAFDWKLLAGRRWSVPFLLAGGLTPENVAEAVNLTGAQQVDVSTGVEAAPGVKDPARIAAFITAAQDGLRPGALVPKLR